MMAGIKVQNFNIESDLVKLNHRAIFCSCILYRCGGVSEYPLHPPIHDVSEIILSFILFDKW